MRGDRDGAVSAAAAAAPGHDGQGAGYGGDKNCGKGKGDWARLKGVQDGESATMRGGGGGD